PLYAGNVKLEGGWSLQDVIQSLNERVFFWPGSEKGPISFGQRHFERYREERPVILRAKTVDIYRANPRKQALYCRYNSGAPRCSFGSGSPRGPSTFLTADATDYRVSQVAEVTYRHKVTLPDFVEIADSPLGPWTKFEETRLSDQH